MLVYTQCLYTHSACIHTVLVYTQCLYTHSACIHTVLVTECLYTHSACIHTVLVYTRWIQSLWCLGIEFEVVAMCMHTHGWPIFQIKEMRLLQQSGRGRVWLHGIAILLLYNYICVHDHERQINVNTDTPIKTKNFYWGKCLGYLHTSFTHIVWLLIYNPAHI